MEIEKELEVKDLIKVAIENIDQSINQTRSEPSTIDENILVMNVSIRQDISQLLEDTNSLNMKR